MHKRLQYHRYQYKKKQYQLYKKLKYKRTGIVITTHGFNGIFVRQCIDCYLRYLENIFIVLYVNESSDPKILSIEKDYPSIKYFYIEDQNESGGLTNTWNEGIRECIKNRCEIIILSNDDIYFDSSIKNILIEASKCSLNENKYYGPLSNNPGPAEANKINQFSLIQKNKESYECKYKNSYFNLNGFFMVFPVHVLKRNKYYDTYFNPEYPFNYGEVDWFNRFLYLNGKPIVVPKTFIYHYKLRSWRNKKLNNICIFTINFGNYEKDRILLKNDTDIDNIYFTDCPEIKKGSLIANLIEKNILFFYIDCKKYKSNNWWSVEKQIQRHLKTFPYDFLPHQYNKSIYVDGHIELKKKFYIKDVEEYLENYDLICFDHPHRKPRKVFEEYKAVIKLKVEKKENADKILKLQKNDNFPDDIGLTETNILIRNHKNIYDFSKEWKNCIYLCIRDQISFDYLLWKHKVNYNRLPIEEKPVKMHRHLNPIKRKWN